jgi:hypothetical protein
MLELVFFAFFKLLIVGNFAIDNFGCKYYNIFEIAIFNSDKFILIKPHVLRSSKIIIQLSLSCQSGLLSYIENVIK